MAKDRKPVRRKDPDRRTRHGRCDTSPEMIRLTVEETQALVWRSESMTLAEIAKRQGVHESTVSRRVKRALADALKYRLDVGEEQLQFALEQLDLLFRPLVKKIKKGDVRSVEAGRKILADKHRLLGLEQVKAKPLAGDPRVIIAELFGLNEEQIAALLAMSAVQPEEA